MTPCPFVADVSWIWVATCACASPAKPIANARPASLPIPCRNNCKFILRILSVLPRFHCIWRSENALRLQVGTFSIGGFSMALELSARPQLQHLTAQINELKARGTHFRLRVLDDVQAPVCTYDGKQVINLASNNYLGLTAHPKLREAAIQATKDYGVGSGAVRTIAGTMKIHMELEEKIARFKNVEACVVFQSGFTANAGTVSSILGKDEFIISDELNHASIIDGARLSRAKIKVFRHKDMAHAEELLKEVQNEPGHKLMITDGVFSMDGDIGPLPALCDLAEKYGAIMMVDDAHASGVLGRNGRGTIDHFNVHGRVDVQVGTLSKAIGALG